VDQKNDSAGPQAESGIIVSLFMELFRMPVYQLSRQITFPPAGDADESGLLAVGGDLSTERLILAYSSGIFPWPHEGYPLLWFSPDPRMVLAPADLPVRKRLERSIRSRNYRFSLDTAFREVMTRCGSSPPRREEGTWITEEMINAYDQLHKLGVAHSMECWQGEELVGGLYGVAVGAVFVGESMFSQVTDASKAAFHRLVAQLGRWQFSLMDAQVHTDHLASLGMEPMPRDEYLATLGRALEHRQPLDNWVLDRDLAGQG
jgi:leucyl/phenylalanyl-tRNA--protein transferase